MAIGVQAAIDADPMEQVLTVHRQGVSPVTLGVEDTLTLPDLLPGFSFLLSRVFGR